MTRRSTEAPEGAAAQGAAPKAVTRILARELIHEGALRRPGEAVTLTPDVIAVLEPEGQFEPARAGKEV